MLLERTSVGLDVHARSVVACGDRRADRGGVRARLSPAPARSSGGCASCRAGGGGLRGRADGVRLARSDRARVACVVAAPSKLQRPAGTGSRPTPGTRCIWPGCCAWARSPRSPCPPGAGSRPGPGPGPGGRPRRSDAGPAPAVQAAAAPRHRLLRRHGLDRRARAWLRAQRFDRPGAAAGLRRRLRGGAAAAARRDRLDKAIAAMAADSEYTGRGRRLALPARHPHADRVRPGGGDR